MPRSAGSKPAPRHRKKPDPLAQAVGSRVSALRKQAGFNFDAFVEETGLGRGYISELERGLVVPGLHALAKLAVALNVSMSDLVAGDSPRDELYELTRGLPDAEVKRLIEHVRKVRDGGRTR